MVRIEGIRHKGWGGEEEGKREVHSCHGLCHLLQSRCRRHGDTRATFYYNRVCRLQMMYDVPRSGGRPYSHHRCHLSFLHRLSVSLLRLRTSHFDTPHPYRCSLCSHNFGVTSVHNHRTCSCYQSRTFALCCILPVQILLTYIDDV